MTSNPGASLPRVQVTFGRMVSDGNYGHETFAVTLEQDMLPDEPGDGEITATLLGELARRVVQAELGRSANATIRNTLGFEARAAAAAIARPTGQNGEDIEAEQEIEGHVCDRHHAIGQSFPCADAGPDGGDCAHVQTAPCDCAEPVGCDGSG